MLTVLVKSAPLFLSHMLTFSLLGFPAVRLAIHVKGTSEAHA